MEELGPILKTLNFPMKSGAIVPIFALEGWKHLFDTFLTKITLAGHWPFYVQFYRFGRQVMREVYTPGFKVSD